MEDKKQNQTTADTEAKRPTPADQSYKAATHSAGAAPHTHPGHAEVSRESTGRAADESWKTKKN